MKKLIINADLHVHSTFSSDGENSIDEMCSAALDKKLALIAFTDHIDIDYPNQEYAFPFDTERYKREIEAAQRKYQGKLDVVRGLEIGLQSHIRSEIDDIISKVEPDFVIGSTHCVMREEISRYGLFKNRSMLDSYDRYFDGMIDNLLSLDNFDAVGHLDFVERYYPADDRILQYANHSTKIDRILELIVQKGKALEINTSGFRYRLNKTHPSVDIIRRYHELGGRLITAGSDSHRAQDVAADFDIAAEILADAGFNAYTIYRKRQPVLCPLK